MTSHFDYCQNFKAIFVGVDSEKIMIVRARCKMWSCEYCAAKNRAMWRARIIDHIEKSDCAWTWFTLTAHSRARGVASLANLRRAWDTLIKRMKRRYGKFDYCRVYERHADGSYHLHAIAGFHFGDIKERKSRKDGTKTKYSVWLKRNASELSLGYYTHADDIDIRHSGYIASYVTKYMTKWTIEQKLEVGRVRHIQVSQGWGRFAESQARWQVKSAFYESDMLDAIRAKKPVVDINSGETITYDYFIENVMYPPDFDANFREWREAQA